MHVPEARLGIPTSYPVHDSRGWRNEEALTKADIVVFGDSQTYGLNVPYISGALRTVLSPAYHLLAETKQDPRVTEGRRINLLALNHIFGKTKDVGAAFYVVLIPTKELAFRTSARAVLKNEPYLNELWDEELGARAEAIRYLSDRGIRVIDTLPNLEALIHAGVNPYKQSHDVSMDDADGHPVPAGYAAIAGAVADVLTRGR
jgi:lysophospholipase L1-like esterase